MAKKPRRAKAKQRARAAREKQKRYPQSLKSVTTKPQSSAGVSPEAEGLITRDRYLMPELRRIGILAGAIIVVLIILSFVLG